MSSWSYLIRFRATDNLVYFASLKSAEDVTSIVGQSVTAYATLSDLEEEKAPILTVVDQVSKICW